MNLSKDGSIHVTDERINVVTSMVGSVFALTFSLVMIGRALEVGVAGYQLAALALYGFALCAMYVLSTLHHVLNRSKRVDVVFQTLDYASIFVLIASTVTAVIAFRFENTFGVAVLAASWVIAACGIALRSSIRHLPKYITNTFYIALGWIPALALLLQPGSLSLLELGLLALGGGLYSIGFAVYVKESPNPVPGLFGFHEIWHLLVLAASVCHWLLIYSFLA